MTATTEAHLPPDLSAAQIEVPYVDLAVRDDTLRSAMLAAVDRVLRSGQFVLGPEVEAFEREFAAYCGTRYAVGVANGTDALILSLQALGIGPGDEVITAPNSFLASASAIAIAGARPVFADVRHDYNIDPACVANAITPRTRAILPVHLTGRPADMDAIMDIAARHHLAVVEDCAQAVGARYRGRSVGTFGEAGCFSLHPLKNLSACGDGGVIVTDDEALYLRLRRARNHGLVDRDACEFWSANSRLDALQASILRAKLPHLDGWTEARRTTAAYYAERLRDVVDVPMTRPHEYAVYHTFVIQADERDELIAFLARNGVGAKIHYPIPCHLQKAALSLGYRKGDFPVTEAQSRRIVSLPVYPALGAAQRDHVVRAVRRFYGER